MHKDNLQDINFHTWLQVDPGATVNFLNLGTHMMTSDRPLLNINILFPKQVAGFVINYHLRSDQLHMENFWGGW